MTGFLQISDFRVRSTPNKAGSMAKLDYSVTIYQNADTHKLLHDLYIITRKQIETLRQRVDKGDELDSKDLKALDSAYDGLKKLISIQKELKSDKLAAMTDDELQYLVRKTQKEGRASAKKTPEDIASPKKKTRKKVKA